MDHDRLFKELLTAFFVEFVELFLPDVSGYLDPDSLEFIDKEVFTDVTAGAKHEVDLVVKARFRGQEAFFLIHVENQASARSEFPKRMFRYFARLHEKHDLPVYPVVIFSYDEPQRPEPDHYEVAFPGKTVLQFDYTVIQLNRLPWRQFVARPNPVATALMAKMQMSPDERPKVKLECLRLLATLKLDPAKSELIGGFVDTYLALTLDETKQYGVEFAKLNPVEQEKTMELMTSWRREGREQGREEGREQGREEGRQEGKEELLVRLINRRFGSVSPQTLERLDLLSSEQLNDLGEALFDFAAVAELESWLSNHPPQQDNIAV